MSELDKLRACLESAKRFTGDLIVGQNIGHESYSAICMALKWFDRYADEMTAKVPHDG